MMKGDIVKILNLSADQIESIWSCMNGSDTKMKIMIPAIFEMKFIVDDVSEYGITLYDFSFYKFGMRFKESQLIKVTNGI